MPHFFTSVRGFGLGAGLLLLGVLPSPAQTPDPSDTTYVRFNTSLGTLDVLLLTHEAPLNTANFLSYVNNGSYSNVIINRSIPGFVFQAGEFTLVSNSSGNSIGSNTPGTAVTGEHSLPGAFSNARGTIAFALGANQSTGLTDPNSGTNQWFFNLEDNNNDTTSEANLDSQGFTAFGVVANASSLAVMDSIAAVPVMLPPNPFVSSADYAADPNPNPLAKPDDFAFGRVPLINYDSTQGLLISNLVLVSVTQLTTYLNYQTNGFQGDANAATDSAPAATPKGDGAPNLLKYFCGVNTTDANASLSASERAKLPTGGKTTISNVVTQTLTYHARPNPVGVTMAVQTSSDLQTWSTPNNLTTVQTGTDSDGNAIMQAQVPAPTTGTQFMRLSLTPGSSTL